MGGWGGGGLRADYGDKFCVENGDAARVVAVMVFAVAFVLVLPTAVVVPTVRMVDGDMAVTLSTALAIT
jgi:hypothetical protein